MAHQLFKTALEKGFFPNPAACLSTIKKRIDGLQKDVDEATLHDIASLEELAVALEEITPETFSKYQKLISVIQDKKNGFDWTGENKKDQIIIFTERIETLKFLHENLLKDLHLKENQVVILHGGLADVDQQGILARKVPRYACSLHPTWPRKVSTFII